MFLIPIAIQGVMLIQDASSEIYKYKDKNGIECFTDSLQSVPEQYREKAVIIHGQTEKEQSKQCDMKPFLKVNPAS
jgi:hypothetical protein